MSLIAEAIGIVKTLIENKMVTPNELPAMLESVHHSLLVMSANETASPSEPVKPHVVQQPSPHPPAEAAHGQPQLPSPAQSTAEVSVPTEIIPPPAPRSEASTLPHSIHAQASHPVPMAPPPTNPDRITCLICGQNMQRLTTHLRSAHQMSADAYRIRFNLPADMPLVSPSQSQRHIEANLQRDSAANLHKDPSPVAAIPADQTTEPAVLAHAVDPEVTQQPAGSTPTDTSAENSITSAPENDDDVIKCLICGHASKRLHPHLKTDHKMSEAAYRHRFNIPGSASLIAPSLSRQIGEKTRARHAAARLAREEMAKLTVLPMNEEEVTQAIPSSAETPVQPFDHSTLVEDLRAWRAKEKLSEASVASMLSIEPPLMANIMLRNIAPSPEVTDRIHALLQGRPQPGDPPQEQDSPSQALKNTEPYTEAPTTPDEEDDVAALVAELRTWQARRNLSQAAVASRLRISKTLMSGILLQKNKISPEIAARIKELIRG